MQPHVIEDSQVIALGTTADNVIILNPSLKSLQRIPFTGRGELSFVVSAAGLLVSLDYGSKNVVESSEGRVDTTFTVPFDTINSEWYAPEGSMLILRAANPTGGNITLRYRIVIYPMAEQGQPFDLSPYPDCRVQQRGPRSIANGSIDTALLDGLRYERPEVDSVVEFFMTASAAGLTRQIAIATEKIAPPSAVGALNRIPQDPTDSIVSEIEAPADKEINLSVTNQSGGALNVFWREKLYEQYRV